MSVSYKGLWKILIDKEINKTTFRDRAEISNGTLAKLGKNEYVALNVLEKICTLLNCKIEDVVEFIPDNEKEDSN